MADCDFCNLGDCVRRDAVKRFEKLVILKLKVLAYVCALALGATVGVMIADSVTASTFNNVALLLPARICAGVLVGTCAMITGLILLNVLLDL